jgi:outer membrane protein TolC
MIKSSFFTICCLILALASAAAQVLPIDSCYALAVRNYPLIKQYDLIEKTKEYTLSNAGKAYLPQLSVTAIEGYILGNLPSFGPSTESSSRLKFIGIAQVNQTIWDGGATKTQKEIINARSETNKASVEVSLYELRSRVNQLYFGILLLDDQLIQLEVQKNILNNNVGRIRQLNENGLAYKTDLDEIRVELLKLDQQKTELNYTRNGYITMLSLLIGVRIQDPIALQKPAVVNGFSSLEITRPELGLYKSQRNLINAEAGMQKVNMMPKIGVLGAGLLLAPGMNFGNSKLSSIGVAGISASWNISGLYRNSNDKKLTQQQLHQVDVQEETFLFNTRFQMTQTNANIEKQKAILAGDDEILSLRKTIREGYQTKYDAGAGPLLDLLNATEKESEARTQRSLHEMQLLMTQFDYKTITGNQ